MWWHHATQTRQRSRIGEYFLGGAAILHIASVPLVLILLKLFVEREVGSSVTWGELFNALGQTGGLPLVFAGIFMQFLFAIVAVMGAVFLTRQTLGVPVAMIVIGAMAAVLSLVIFGGIFGAAGGILSIVGGVTAWPRPAAYPYPPPPAYPVPPPMAPWSPQGPRLP
jgi:hypothetical protein